MQRSVAEGEIGEREEAVEQEQRAESPGEEGGEGRVEGAQVEALDALRAEPVLPARRLPLVAEEASPRLLRHDAPEAEIGEAALLGVQLLFVAFVLGGSGHRWKLSAARGNGNCKRNCNGIEPQSHRATGEQLCFSLWLCGLK